MNAPGESRDRLADAVGRAAHRREEGERNPEPSLGARLGQIGILGWTIVAPVLMGLLIGRWLDRLLGSGIMFAAAFICAGAAFGLWAAWRWMRGTTR